MQNIHRKNIKITMTGAFSCPAANLLPGAENDDGPAVQLCDSRSSRLSALRVISVATQADVLLIWLMSSRC